MLSIARACIVALALGLLACTGGGTARSHLSLTDGDEHEQASGGPCADWQVHFATGSAELDADARSKLVGLAECIREGAIDEVRIVGSADPRGTDDANLELGERRAGAVRAHLVSLGCDAGDIRVRSIGESSASSDADEWQTDRRASVRTESD